MITGAIKNWFQKSFQFKRIFNWQRSIMNHEMSLEEWEKAGKPLPVPANVKRQLMQDAVRTYHPTIFVETGTFAGDTTDAMKPFFTKLYTIEVDARLAKNAAKRFSADQNITVIHGDSGQKIKELLSKIPQTEKCLFWLDGHYSGGVTSRGASDTPVMEELIAVLNHNTSHIILIDDARLFNGTNDYPDMETLAATLKKYQAPVAMDIVYDIIRIVPEIKN